MKLITTLQAKTLIRFDVPATESTVKFLIGERCPIDNAYRVSIFIRSKDGDRSSYFLTNKKSEFARTFMTFESAVNACEEIMGKSAIIDVCFGA